MAHPISASVNPIGRSSIEASAGGIPPTSRSTSRFVDNFRTKAESLPISVAPHVAEPVPSSAKQIAASVRWE